MRKLLSKLSQWLGHAAGLTGPSIEVVESPKQKKFYDVGAYGPPPAVKNQWDYVDPIWAEKQRAILEQVRGQEHLDSLPFSGHGFENEPSLGRAGHSLGRE